MSQGKCSLSFAFVSTRNYFLAKKWGITANVSRLGEGREFENRQPKLSTNVDRITNVQLLTSALLLPNRC